MTARDSAVVHDAERQRFEIRDGDVVSRLSYRIDGGVMDMLHTVVPPPLEGRGVGSALARAALEYAASQKLPVRPTCPFVREYLKRHPDAATLADGVLP